LEKKQELNMKPSSRLRNSRRILTLIAFPILLAACGGGASTTTTYSLVPVVPVVQTLTGTGGDMSKYANAGWSSVCGLVILGGSGGVGQTSQTNYFSFGQIPSVGTASGASHLRITRYSGSYCSGTPSFGSGLATQITVKYVKEVAITSSTPPSFQGTADELLITDTATGVTQTFVAAFEPGYGKFYGSSTPYISSGTLSYTKGKPGL
jgi:hypothetical protein